MRNKDNMKKIIPEDKEFGNRKKIAIVSEFCIPYLYGGGEFRYYFLSKELQKLGYDVKWICMRFINEKGKIPKKEKIDGINVIHLGPLIKNPPYRSVFNFIHYSWALFWHLLRNKYDLIDAQAFIPLIPSLAASRIKRTRIIATIHDVSKGNDDQWIQYGRIAPFLEKVIYKLPYQKIITVSRSIKQELIENFKIRQEKISVVNNGVNLEFIDQIKPQLNPKRLYKKERDSICFTGRLVNTKRLQDLIFAVELLKKKIPKIRLKIIGSGPEENSLKSLVHKLGLTKNVLFFTKKNDSDKFRELKKSEIFVLPSVREGFGIVLIEAMACQTAVIGAKIDGIKDVIHEKVDGLFFEPKNPADLAEKLDTLLRNKKMRLKLAKEGRKKVETRFQWKDKVREIEAIYFH